MCSFRIFIKFPRERVERMVAIIKTMKKMRMIKMKRKKGIKRYRFLYLCIQLLVKTEALRTFCTHKLSTKQGGK